ncbi:MAG: Fic family protein [Phycisphaerae bacterium]|nr:Fic family protein [Phycisphaerae bacterium]
MPSVRYHRGVFPPSNLDWLQLVPLLGPASAALARYDGVLSAIPNPQVLLSPLTTQEAVLSSRIEGTQATMTEVLEFEAKDEPGETDERKAADIYEVLNYRQAIRQAKDMLAELPLSGRLIRSAHETLLQGVRGKSKAPGEYRKIQNLIGLPGCTEDTARFVPIGAGDLPSGMSAWEKYLNSKEPDVLVQLAIVHAEFEALHPFLDGNGRLGRMLIPLFLFERKLLAAPTFYLSAYLEARREEYYDRLLAVSRDGDWTGWCVFFLGALTAQAESNTRKAKQILDLYETKKSWIADQTHSQHAMRALDFLFDRPIFASSDFVAAAGIPKDTARRILTVLRDEGLLRVVREAAGRRTAILVFPELLNIAEGQEAF